MQNEFCHDSSLRDWHVMYMTILMHLIFVEQICCCVRARMRLVTANTSTTCCCEHVRNTAAENITYMKQPNIAYMNNLVADLYRWSWGGGGFLEHAVNCYSKHQSYI